MWYEILEVKSYIFSPILTCLIPSCLWEGPGSDFHILNFLQFESPKDNHIRTQHLKTWDLFLIFFLKETLVGEANCLLFPVWLNNSKVELAVKMEFEHYKHFREKFKGENSAQGNNTSFGRQISRKIIRILCCVLYIRARSVGFEIVHFQVKLLKLQFGSIWEILE